MFLFLSGVILGILIDFLFIKQKFIYFLENIIDSLDFEREELKNEIKQLKRNQKNPTNKNSRKV
jgi:hypothetical protein